jgi:hypothetical protein
MDSADALYGWPAAALGVRFTRIVKRIQEVRRQLSCCDCLSGYHRWHRAMPKV